MTQLTRTELATSTEERQERFLVAADSWNDLYLGARDQQARLLVHNVLNNLYEVPKSPAGVADLIRLIIDTTSCWLMADGIVTLNPDYVVTDEEREERRRQRAEAKLGQAAPNRPNVVERHAATPYL